MSRPDSSTDRVLSMLEDERARDRFMRRVSTFAWVASFIIAFIFLGISITQFFGAVKMTRMTGTPMAMMLGTLTPAILTLGFLFMLVAVVSTIGMFMRMRSASLQEIQLRLAALEESLTRDKSE